MQSMMHKEGWELPVALGALVVWFLILLFGSAAYAQAEPDPNLSQGQDSVQKSVQTLPQTQENSPATAQYNQYDQYNPSSAGQYGVLELPDTGGPNLLAMGVVLGIVLVVSGGVVLRLLRR
jgi:hypothetical protein